MSASALPKSVDAMLELLTSRGYFAERSLATVAYLSLRMGRPLFLEGEAGVGKTEIAKVLSAPLGRNLIRRLMRLSDGMLAIAGGSHHTAIDVSGTDEVAEMARVVEVFSPVRNDWNALESEEPRPGRWP